MKTLIQFTIAVSCIFLTATGTSSAQDITNADGSPFKTAYCNVDSNYEIVGIPAGGTFTGCGVTKKSGKWYFNPVVAAASIPVNFYPRQCSLVYTAPGNIIVTKYITTHAPVDIRMIVDTPTCGGAFVLNGNTGVAGAISFKWSPATGLSNPDQAQTYAFITATQTYTLLVRDINTNCSDSLPVKLNYIPGNSNLRLEANKYVADLGDSIVLEVLGDISFKVQTWLPQYLFSSLLPLQKIKLNRSENITVIVNSIEGCREFATLQIAAFPASVNTLGQSENISIYPNPAKDVINIDAAVAVDATITTIDGRVVLKQENATKVNIAHLAAGTYIIQVVDKQGNVLRREQVVKVAQ